VGNLLAATRARLRAVLGATEPPERIAAAWALGIGIGLSPLLGLHTVGALLLAVLLRLNKVDVLLGTMISNPWVLAAYFPACVVLGQWLLGIDVPRVAIPELNQLFSPSAWREQGEWLRPLMVAWWAGSGAVAIIGAGVTYFAVRAAVNRHRRKLGTLPHSQ
jgi:uncharacterized protein